VKPAAFTYHRPDTVDEAVALLAELGDDAKVLAGGQSLIPMLAMRLAVFPHLIDIGRVVELDVVEPSNGTVTIGAVTTQARVEADPGLAASVPLMARATPLIGHFQIRNRGTVGGSLAHADPAAEYPAVALALDASVEAVSVRGRRTIPAAEFFTGLWSTALEPDELLARVRFPVWSGRCGFALEEFARRHGDFAIAGAVVGLQLDGDDRIERAAIAHFGLGSTPGRAGEVEAEVTGRPSGEVAAGEVGRLAMSHVTEPADDLQGSASYRLRVGAAMIERAWTRAIEEARRA
jgi:carbon-monoxide dehydrogenase medium subunit